MPNGDEPKKRKKVTAQTLFMRTFRESNTSFRGMPMSDMGLIRAANAAFDKLPRADQEKYDLAAKRQNKEKTATEGHIWQRDTLGVLATDNHRQKHGELAWLDEMRTKIIDIVGRPNLESKVFIAALVNGISPMDKNDVNSTYCPVEISMLKFSMAHGVMDSLNLMIYPFDIPIGSTFLFLDQIEISVGLRPPETAETTNLQEMYTKIVHFCGGRNTPNPIYCPRENMWAMRHSLYRIAEHLHLRSLFVPDIDNWVQFSRVYCLEDLMSTFILHRETPDELTSQSVLTFHQLTTVDLATLPDWIWDEGACSEHREAGLIQMCTRQKLYLTIHSSFLRLVGCYPSINLHDPHVLPTQLLNYMTEKDRRDENRGEETVPASINGFSNHWKEKDDQIEEMLSGRFEDMSVNGADSGGPKPPGFGGGDAEGNRPPVRVGLGRGRGISTRSNSSSASVSGSRSGANAEKKRRMPKLDF